MIIDLDTILRSRINPAVNGQVMLDRSAKGPFWLDPGKLQVLKDFVVRMLRIPTTGHNNLPLGAHMNPPIHTYFGPDFTTAVAGNYWHPAYNVADGGVAAPIALSEILSFAAYGEIWKVVGGYIHLYLDWKSGVSESRVVGPENGTPLLHDYRDPFAKDIDGNDIPPGVLAGMIDVDFKCLENRRILRFLIEDVGIPPSLIILNMGGEDWGGDEEPFPWIAHTGDDQDAKSLWQTQHREIFLRDIHAYIEEQGWVGIRLGVAFLESIESGTPVPLDPDNIRRNLKHFLMELDETGDVLDFGACSMHLRSAWTHADPNKSFIDQRRVILAWFTESGMGTLKEIYDYFKSLVTDHVPSYPNIDLVPMANSIGDANDNGPVWEQWQRGFGGVHYLIDLIDGGYSFADGFNGFWGNNGQTDQGNLGLTGAFKTGPDLHPFTIHPIYYALLPFGAILDTEPDLVDVIYEGGEDVGAPLIASALAFTKQLVPGVAVWLINKSLTDARTIPLKITGKNRTISQVAVQRRYSETETLNPIVTDAVITITAGEITVVLPAMSIVHLEIHFLTGLFVRVLHQSPTIIVRVLR